MAVNHICILQQCVSIAPQIFGVVRFLRPDPRILDSFWPNLVKTRRTGGDQTGNGTALKQLQMQVQSRPAQPATLQRFQRLCEMKMAHGAYKAFIENGVSKAARAASRALAAKFSQENRSMIRRLALPMLSRILGEASRTIKALARDCADLG